MERYIYVDVFFLRIFFMNMLCLKSLNLLLRKNSPWKRIILGSSAGTFWNMIPVLTGVYIKGMSLPVAYIMCVCAFGIGKDKGGTNPIYLLFIGFCMEGSIRWLDSMNGCLVVPVICWLIGCKKRRNETEVKVVLSFRGRKKILKGFYDSGNRLSEPITGKKVHIVCYDNIREILPECYRQAVEYYFETGILNSTKVTELQMYEFTFLSYHSIGKENGQLLGIRMDSADFISQAGKKTEEKVVIGLTKQRLFVRGQDRMIVNGRLEL